MVNPKCYDICGRDKDNDQIRCDICKAWYHKYCAAEMDSDYASLLEEQLLDSKDPKKKCKTPTGFWMCSSCDDLLRKCRQIPDMLELLSTIDKQNAIILDQRQHIDYLIRTQNTEHNTHATEMDTDPPAPVKLKKPPPPRNIQTLIVGSSHLRGLKLHIKYNEAYIACRPGATAVKLQQEATKWEANDAVTAVVLLVGGNDLAQTQEIEAVSADIITLADLLQSKYTNAILHVIGVLKRDQTANVLTHDLNKALANSFSNTPTIKFSDPNPALNDTHLQKDGVHLNAEGTLVLANHIRGILSLPLKKQHEKSTKNEHAPPTNKQTTKQIYTHAQANPHKTHSKTQNEWRKHTATTSRHQAHIQCHCQPRYPDSRYHPYPYPNPNPEHTSVAYPTHYVHQVPPTQPTLVTRHNDYHHQPSQPPRVEPPRPLLPSGYPIGMHPQTSSAPRVEQPQPLLPPGYALTMPPRNQPPPLLPSPHVQIYPPHN